jgi:metallo-beta-lactamase class B
MRRLTAHTVLIAVLGVAAVAIPVLFVAWRAAINRSEQQQVGSADPFRIAGNLYYVGTSALSVFLITGPDGHVLLDSGYPPATIASLATLGFNIKDVKAVIASDAHDGAQGVAELQRASGAQVWAGNANARVIAAGGNDPDFAQPMKFLARLGAMRYPAARVDHVVKDGETIRVGPIAVTAHITPGASRGCTSWSFPVRDGDRVLNVVSVCPLTRVGGIRYPGQDADLERSFGVLRSLPVDIWVTGRSRDWGRFRKFEDSRSAKDPVKAFIDPGGYLAYIDVAEGQLRTGIVN